MEARAPSARCLASPRRAAPSIAAVPGWRHGPGLHGPVGPVPAAHPAPAATSHPRGRRGPLAAAVAEVTSLRHLGDTGGREDAGVCWLQGARQPHGQPGDGARPVGSQRTRLGSHRAGTPTQAGTFGQ